MSTEVKIVGAGLVGSMLGVRLCQLGYQVEIFEKRSDPRLNSADRGRSINLVITSRGIATLEQAGLREQILQQTVPVFGRLMHSKEGALTYQAYGGDKECNYSVSRAELNKSLISEFERNGGRVHFNSPLEDVEFSKNQARFGGYGSITYEVLISAEGAGSKLREIYQRQGITSQTEFLPIDYKELFLPREKAEDLKMNALHIWARGSHMMMALPNLDGSFTVTLYLPKTGGQWNFTELNSAQRVQQLFASEFPDAIARMPSFVEDFLRNPQGELGTVRTVKWNHGNTCLIGDAAHAIVPFFGQGMNLGFEDISCLVSCLDGESSWAKRFEIFSHRQKENADAIASMAIENFSEMSSSVTDPKFLLRKQLEGSLEKKYPGLYKSRYGMITYTLIPYRTAQKAGKIQENFLKEICQSANSLEEISEEKLTAFIHGPWLEFAREHQLAI